MAKKITDKKNDAKTALLIGAGVAALTAAGVYFFGPRGKAHRKEAKGWMIRMKGEIIERMENAKEMTEEAYHNIIDAVTAQYKKHGKIAEEDIETLAKELKAHWKGIASASVSSNRRPRQTSSRTKKTGGKKNRTART